MLLLLFLRQNTEYVIFALVEFSRVLFRSSYQRAVAGGRQTLSLAAQNPMGMRGLLVTWRDEAMGIVPAQPAAPLVPAVPDVPEVTVATVPEVPAVPEATAPAATGLPTFLGGGAVEASLASHCNKIG